ncbi:MAG: SsrA-binding protein SmpB [Actinobacteria bacterium]|nr:SsrA-binding protein SmpB [Actinomycetota bacterium]
MSAKNDRRSPVIATNRQARHDYEILEEVEAGIMLAGSEVKSLREAKVTLSDAYARIIAGELWLIGLHIAPYSHAAAHTGHIVDRDRKLLVHRHQIEHLNARLAVEHLTLVPLQMRFVNGRVKVDVALARGRKLHDKRQLIAKRDADLEARRAMAAANRRGDR